MSGAGSSPALATCETSQVLLAGVAGGFSLGSPVFAPPTDWPVLYELNNLERDVKLSQKERKADVSDIGFTVVYSVYHLL